MSRRVTDTRDHYLDTMWRQRHVTTGDTSRPRTRSLPSDAPPGHALAVQRVSSGVGYTGVWEPSRAGVNTARDGWRGVCECGRVFDRSTRLVHDWPPPYGHVVEAWHDHVTTLL